MPLSLAILGFFVHIDAQRDPIMALAAAGAAGGFLWFVVVQARRREERKAEAERGGTSPRNRGW